MKIKILLTFFILTAIFISGCATEKLIKPSGKRADDWLSYENKDLGISLRHPPTFEVYQTDNDTLRVDGGYEDAQQPLTQIFLGMRRVNKQRESEEQIGFRLQNKSIINRQNKDNYELIEFEGGQYYILSDKGTFHVGDTLDMWKSKFEEEGIYQDYRTKLDKIRDSIKII